MDKAKAAKLKDQGNALFVKKDYPSAYNKYSDALRYDDDNAILYCNRAACALARKDYNLASADAKKATELDPTYAKAWARIAAARVGLGNVSDSIECWKTALAVLPQDNLSPAEVKQKKEYEAGLQAAIALRDAPPPVPYIVVKDGATKAPWVRAEAMIPMLRILGNARVNSSAWVIWGAHEDWSGGMQMIKQLKQKHTREGLQLFGNRGAIGELTNGLIRDPRIFHIVDQNWVELYNNQARFECQVSRAWTGDSAQVIAEALPMQKRQGWDVVRPAIATTIRAWIMQAIGAHKILDKLEYALELYDYVLDVLRWGSQVWRSVSMEDRGAVFETTFIRGVRSLRLQTMMEVCQKGSDKCSLEDLYEESQDIVRDVDEALGTRSLNTAVDPGFVSSFFIYPKGQAYAMQGFYHNQMARRCALAGESVEAVRDHTSKAAKAYLQAGHTYPDDDEMHPWFLNCALEGLYRSGTPIKDVLPVLASIRLSIPKMKEIWEHSAMALGGRDKALQQAVWNEEDVLKGLAEGKYTMEDKIMPDYYTK